MKTKINKEKIELIRRIRRHTLDYGIASLNQRNMVDLVVLALLHELERAEQ